MITDEVEVEITDLIVDETLERIISELQRFEGLGYNKIYFDGYDAALYVYKSKIPPEIEYKIEALYP